MSFSSKGPSNGACMDSHSFWARVAEIFPEYRENKENREANHCFYALRATPLLIFLL